MSSIKPKYLILVKKLYNEDGFSMNDIALKLGVSLNAVLHFMRKNKIKRRNYFEANKHKFNKKLPSFKKRAIVSQSQKDIERVGVTLYWAEGYKTAKSTGVDFANSDPVMISVFLNFLRTTYELDEKKFRILLYCYSDQNIDQLIQFWSKLTRISKKQFTKPFVRKDFRKDGRKMQYGLVHIRYHDKKLLWDIMSLVEQYKKKFASVV